MTNKLRPCGNDECSISTFIDEVTFTFGSGELSDIGCWEIECRICALDYLEKHPEAKVMPKVSVAESVWKEF